MTYEQFSKLVKNATPGSFYKNEFVFCALNTEDKDALFIHTRYGKPISELITYIQDKAIKKVNIIAEDISFLQRCPSIECVKVVPAYTADRFDFSPLYRMPNLKWLDCETVYGPQDKKVAHIDCSRLSCIERLGITGKVNDLQLRGMKLLKTLYLERFSLRQENLLVLSDCSGLNNLCICQSSVKSLEGIASLKNLKRLDLALCSKLEDISALSSCAESLSWLCIESCNKIVDFTPLAKLKNLEYLSIKGNNTIPNLSFVKEMPNLKHLFFTVKVEDGDLSICEGIPYVYFVDRRHYSHKARDFPTDSSFKPKLVYYEGE